MFTKPSRHKAACRVPRKPRIKARPLPRGATPGRGLWDAPGGRTAERGFVAARLGKAILLFGLLLPWTSPSQAHALKIFAYGEGNRIEGSVYLKGGTAPTSASITLLTTDGERIAETGIDEEGGFGFTVGEARDYIVQADAGSGHRAEFTLSADELSPALPTPSGHGDQTVRPHDPPMIQGRAADTDLEAMISRAVSRQVVPLRKQIAEYEDRIRWHDILGGIGYILGLAGLAFYLTARRSNHGKDT